MIGIGNAIVDVLADTDDDFLMRHGLAKGTMTLIDAGRAAELYGLLAETVECSGGSAANTMVGLASLGSRAGYIGKVRDDPLGGVFARELRKTGCEFRTPPASTGPGTGRCVVLVTPDAQRTMQTFLGVSATLAPEDVDAELIAGARVTYLEGYLWDPPPAKQAFVEAARLAHSAGRKVALSLSDPFCVERHRGEFRDLVENHVDLLFANEAEIVSLYEADGFDSALGSLRGACELAALTRGGAGSVVLAGERTIEIPAVAVERVIDTTGAGDLYAAGFLHGYCRGDEPGECGRIAGIAAGEIIGHFGARPERRLAELIDP